MNIGLQKGHAKERRTAGRCFALAACIALGSLNLASVQRASAQGIPCRYEVAAVIQAHDGPISESPTYATAISPNGEFVVGRFRFDAVGEDAPFFWSQATGFMALPLPPGFYAATPADITDDRVMCGTGWISGVGQRGYVYDMNTGGFTLLPPLPGGAWSGATGISAFNTVCGFRSIGSKGDPVNPFQAFVWTASDGFTDLGVLSGPNSSAMDISDDGIVVGWAGGNLSSFNARAFIHADGQTTVLGTVPNGVASAAVAVNGGGTVAIYGRMVQSGGGMPRAFMYRDHAFIDLGLLPGFDIALAADIGPNDTVVGTLRRFSPSLDRGFIWQSGQMRNLQNLIPSQPTLAVVAATAISPSGIVVCGAHNEEGEVVSLVLTPTSVIGDVYPDCVVNIDDLLTVIQWWGPGTSPGDANGDGTVNLTDLLIVIEHWST